MKAEMMQVIWDHPGLPPSLLGSPSCHADLPAGIQALSVVTFTAKVTFRPHFWTMLPSSSWMANTPLIALGLLPVPTMPLSPTPSSWLGLLELGLWQLPSFPHHLLSCVLTSQTATDSCRAGPGPQPSPRRFNSHSWLLCPKPHS